MGKKSEQKKIKSDRINVLRKQYDAFLEEDKKRKDRNEYILGRLDKMRYSSTAVQLRQKANIYGDVYPKPHNHHAYRPENIERNDMQMVQVNQQLARPYQSLPLDNSRNVIGETSLIKEISKKYILIPKLSSMYPSDHIDAILPQATDPAPPVKSNVVDNHDWKSKYDILEQLKKNEDELKFTNMEDHSNNNETMPKTNQGRANDIDHVMQKYKTEDLKPSYGDELPEKDVSSQLAVENELKSLDKCTIHENIDQMPQTVATNITNNQPLKPENIENYYGDTRQNEIVPNVNENVGLEQYDIPVEQNNEALEYQQQGYPEEEYPPQEYPEQEFQPQQDYPVEYEQHIPGAEADINNLIDPDVYIEQETNEYSPVEVINPTELVQEINKENQEAMQDGETEYPIEIINTPDFTPDNAVILVDGQNVNPHYKSNEPSNILENTEPQMQSENTPIDNSGIDEFDAEQREMFYSEQPDENYGYEQQGAGDAYNQEYTQNENYPQTQEYAYYEGAEQEQTYPVEINEHEETQQLYDQHYEQQYTTNFEPGFEQNQVYMEQDPTQQQFEQPAIYDKAQEEFDNYNYEQPANTLEQVEQVLDHEDGYIQKQKEEQAVQEKQDGQSVEQNVL